MRTPIITPLSSRRSNADVACGVTGRIAGSVAAQARSSNARIIELPVVPNARHLGGLPTPDGVTCFHDIVRSGMLTGLLSAGADRLNSMGIRTVIDIWTADERTLAPEPNLTLFGLTQRWIPLVEQDPAPRGVNLEYGHAGFLWMYQNFLEYGRAAMVELVRILANTESGVLYHCWGGQDRTGLVTAALLSLVGVPDDAIIADHSLSVTLEKLAERGITGMAAAQRVSAPSRGMEALLGMVRERWGGVAGYLAEAGSTAPEIQAIREKAVRPR